MALASVTYPSVDGATTTFAVPFPYIAQADVHVYVDGVEDLTFTWPDAATVRPTTTPGAGTDVLVQRLSEQDERLVDFADASVLTEADLDKDSNQNFYLMQELLDEFDDALTEATDGTLDADSRRIKNVADATAAQDAVTKTQLDAAVILSGNVPTPDDPDDDGKELVASGGAFAWTTKAVTAAQVSDASANGRSLITAANYAAMRALVTPLTANGDLWARIGGVDARLAIGTEGQVLEVPSSGGPAWAARTKSGTAVATTSGTEFDYTGIPSWVTRITVTFKGVSLSGTGNLFVQIGDSVGFETTGYMCATGSFSNSGTTVSNSTTGFNIVSGAAAAVHHGSVTLALQDASTNTWTISGNLARSDTTVIAFVAGSKSLSGTLDRVRITRTGTDTFDAGSVNILYA